MTQNEGGMTDHQRYPMAMTHPGYRPARITPIQGNDLKGSFTDYQGTPAKHPPVTVNNADQEEYHAAEGYRPAGSSDPAAYVTAQADPAPAGYEAVEYPKWVDGKLIECAEDDPDYDPAAPLDTLSEAEDEALQLREQNAAQAEEIAKLRALLEQKPEPPKNKGGRPRKAPAEVAA